MAASGRKEWARARGAVDERKRTIPPGNEENPPFTSVSEANAVEAAVPAEGGLIPV
jgi:hypothetical protein